MAKVKGIKLISNAISVFENLTSQLSRGIELCEKEKEVNEVVKAKVVTKEETKVAKIYAKTTRQVDKVRAITAEVVTKVEASNAELNNSIVRAKKVVTNLEKLTN